MPKKTVGVTQSNRTMQQNRAGVKTPLISVIIPNYQGKDILPKCIRSLLKQDFSDYEIVLVDDSSTDGSYALAQKLFSKETRVRIFQTPKNSGYTGAVNLGFKNSTGAYIIVTNNDATYPKNFISEMYSTVKGKDKVVGGGWVIEPATVPFVKALKKGKVVTQTFVVSSAMRTMTPLEKKTGIFETFAVSMFIIPRSALEETVFPEYYFFYCEDIELAWRLHLRGYKFVINTNAVIHHYGSFVKKKVAGVNKRATYHSTKNRLCNLFVLYEKKNVLRILPPFMLVELLLLITRPKSIPYRFKGYLWFLFHPRMVWRHRKAVQSKRTLSDKEALGLISYKLNDELLIESSAEKKMTKVLNTITRWYFKAVFLKTFDRDDEHAVPKVDESAVKKR